MTKIVINRDYRLKQMREYRLKNIDKIQHKAKQYYEKNKDHIKSRNKKYRLSRIDEYKLNMKEYWLKHKHILSPINATRNRNKWKNMTISEKQEYWKNKNAWEKRKKKEDVNYALKKRLRLRVWQAFNGIRKKHSDELGIKYDNIIKHLNTTLPIDYKINPSKYEIDHIIPLSSFDFSDPEQIKKAFAPENHQWLTAEDNLNKRDKLNWIKPKDL
jgi:hypothetical protein